jgi:hypothetical protein
MHGGVRWALLGLPALSHSHSGTESHPHIPAATLHHPQNDRCTVRVRELFPLGGPFTGNTAVTITGVAFLDLGDAKCRFGADEVQARVVSDTRIECSSPGCSSPTCILGQQQTALPVPLEVSMNGVSFTGSGLQFTYYDMAYAGVSLLTPAGGPNAGDTQLRVNGVYFRDLSSGAAGQRLQGLKCKFGANDMVPARLVPLLRTEARCIAPRDRTFNYTAGAQGKYILDVALHAVPLELTFNGYDTPGSLTASAVPYTFYEPTLFNISRIFPFGGPRYGGTELMVYLVDTRLLTDLGGGEHGVHCRFSHTRVVGELGHERTEEVHVRVNATLTDCKARRECGAGWAGLVCRVPPYNLSKGELSPTLDGAEVRVEVTVNGHDYTDSGQVYRYYDTDVWRLHEFHPRGGSLRGNTSLTVRGLRFQNLGDVRCRFGVLNTETNATIESEGVMRCVSPPHWHQQASSQAVDLAITLNGQDYLQARMHQSTFAYYALDEYPTGLSVQRLDPPGGPEAGGTLVTVTGSGFVDVGGLLCKFASEPAVAASLIDQEHVRCYSPPRLADRSDGTYDERHVEVTINSQLHHTTSSAVPFAYYRQAEVAVSKIYPRGGPRGGSTAVTVYGIGFRELGHGPHEGIDGAKPRAGLHCRFGTSELVPATLLTEGGAGPQRLRCASPALPASDRCETRAVRVTNNANNPDTSAPDGSGGVALTAEVVGFTYFDSEEGLEDGVPTPSGATLSADPAYWSGNDVLR